MARNQKRTKSKPDKKPVLLDHIRELQLRLIVSMVLLVAAGVASYFYYHQILDILRAPLNQELYYSTPVGSFAFIMRVCLIGGVAVAIPAIIYNILMFIRPAFTKQLSRLSVMITTLFSIVLAAVGVAFSYFVIIPGALHFFNGFAVDGLNPMIMADSYLSFVVGAMIIFMLIFQLPLIMLLADHLKRLSIKRLFAAEKWVILGSLVASLMVPFALDLSTSLLIAAPIIALYNLTIGIVAIKHKLSKQPAISKPKAKTQIKSAVKSPAPAPAARVEPVKPIVSATISDIKKSSAPVKKPVSTPAKPNQSTAQVKPTASIDVVKRTTPRRPTKLIVPTRSSSGQNTRARFTK